MYTILLGWYIIKLSHYDLCYSTWCVLLLFSKATRYGGCGVIIIIISGVQQKKRLEFVNELGNEYLTLSYTYFMWIRNKTFYCIVKSQRICVESLIFFLYTYANPIAWPFLTQNCASLMTKVSKNQRSEVQQDRPSHTHSYPLQNEVSNVIVYCREKKNSNNKIVSPFVLLSECSLNLSIEIKLKSLYLSWIERISCWKSLVQRVDSLLNSITSCSRSLNFECNRKLLSILVDAINENFHI